MIKSIFLSVWLIIPATICTAQFFQNDEMLSLIERGNEAKARVIFIDFFNVYKDFYESTFAIIDETIEAVDQALEISDISISVRPSRRLIVPEYGIGAISLDENRVHIFFDPEFHGHPDVFKQHLPRVLAHEIFHSMHARQFTDDGTLLAQMVKEGLAVRFAMELFELSPPPWGSAFRASQIDEMIQLACPEFTNSEYNHALWFRARDNVSDPQLGGRGKEVPQWAGYTIGLYLVDRHLQENNIVSPKDVMSAPPQAFLPDEFQCAER